MIRPTRKGILLAAMAAVLYGAAMTSQSSLLLCLIGILLGCAVINCCRALSDVYGVELIAPEISRVTEGEPVRAKWRIRNRRRRSIHHLQATGPDGRLWFQVESVAGRSEGWMESVGAFGQRGVYPYAGAWFVSRYPFGMVECRKRIGVPGRFIVHPAIYAASGPPALSHEVMVGGKAKGRRVSSSGSDFAGVREIRPHDPFKHIHWKMSSRGQGLMVKMFEEELAGRVSMILDAGGSRDLEAADRCVRAAGSLMFAALDEGHHVEWLDLARLKLFRIPPFASGEEILDELAALPLEETARSRSRYDAAVDLCSRRSALCIVAGQDSEAARTVAKSHADRGRKVTLVIPEEEWSDRPPNAVTIGCYGADWLSIKS